MRKLTRKLIGRWTEPAIWVAALMFLALIDPDAAPAFSLCPLQNLGLAFCPGCGLGLSISYVLHGEMLRSLEVHPLGIAATVILVWRICSLAGAPSLRSPGVHPTLT